MILMSHVRLRHREMRHAEMNEQEKPLICLVYCPGRFLATPPLRFSQPNSLGLLADRCFAMATLLTAPNFFSLPC